jgi:hypothetical protein
VVAGIPFPDLASYVANEKLRLFKPHGSVNWGRVIANDVSIIKNRGPEDTEAAVLDLAGKSGIELTNDYTVAETSSNPTVGGRTLLPALTVPIQQKLDFECPLAHIDLLRQSLRELKWVLSIGWRAGEQNFLKLWRDSEPYTQPRLISGNGRAESGEAVVNSLKVAGLRFSDTSIAGSFTQLLKDDTLKHLLERPFRGLGIEP